MRNENDDVIRASELNEYAYCARAWWLRRVRGWQPRNRTDLEAGAARHRAHGQAVRGAEWRQFLGLGLLLAAGLLAGLGVALLVLRGP